MRANEKTPALAGVDSFDAHIRARFGTVLHIRWHSIWHTLLESAQPALEQTTCTE